MVWDYAELSHMAKEAGGPDLLLSTLESNARGQGRIEGAGIGAIVAGFLFAGAALIYKQCSKKKALANEAKLKLADGIRAYEAMSEKVDSKDAGQENTESNPNVEEGHIGEESGGEQ